MSPRAACRLETLGFEEVDDYVEGKADWVARGLPTEGHREDERRIGQLARRDVVTCALDERVGDVRSRVEASPYAVQMPRRQDTKLVKSAGEHHVCAELARRGWAGALTRDGLARTDILAVDTETRTTVEL